MTCAGVWADIILLRAEDARAPDFRAWDDRVKKLEEFALAERRAYCTAKDQSWTKRSGASARLLTARATTRILRIAQGMEDVNDFERRMHYLESEEWTSVRVRAGQGPLMFPRSKAYAKPTCSLCHFKGHMATDCEDPHLKCSAKMSGYCWINPRHCFYKKHNTTLALDCPYDGKQRQTSQAQQRIARANTHQEIHGQRMQPAHDDDATKQDQGETLYPDHVDTD
jgi:hypothetical protein